MANSGEVMTGGYAGARALIRREMFPALLQGSSEREIRVRNDPYFPGVYLEV